MQMSLYWRYLRVMQFWTERERGAVGCDRHSGEMTLLKRDFLVGAADGAVRFPGRRP